MHPERTTRGGNYEGFFGVNFSFSRSVCVSVYSAGLKYGANQVFRKRMVIKIKIILCGHTCK